VAEVVKEKEDHVPVPYVKKGCQGKKCLAQDVVVEPGSKGTAGKGDVGHNTLHVP
jgi:hypothetical protein